MLKQVAFGPRGIRAPRAALIATLIAVLYANAAPHASAQSPQLTVSTELRSQLSRLLAKLPKEAKVGLAVAEVDTGAIWFTHEADTPLVPASLQKLFVTAAALERFGPQFHYQTRVYTHGDELWVVGAGDPAFGDQRLAERDGKDINHAFDEWAGALRARGMTSLSRIVLDDSVFDEQVRHPDWPREQSDRWYQAPVGGLNLNDNCLDVRVVVRGKDIELRLQPDLPPGLVRSTLTRGKQQRATIKRLPDSDIFQVQGTVNAGAALDPVAAGHPTLFFAQALKRALERRGIAVRGEVVRRHLRETELSEAGLLATHATGLPDVLWRCNTFSQNLFAECLMKSLAAYEPGGQRSDRAGGWEQGQAIVRTTLARLGVDLAAATIRDGSGLSHENRATAAQFTRLLVQMRRHPHADVFLNSLARAGEPGSMKNRYNDPVFRGRLRGKTGTLAGVHTLAGYLTRPDGTVLAFALLTNGHADATLPAQVCKILVGAEEAKNGK